MSFDRVDEVKGLRDMCDSLLVRAEAAEAAQSRVEAVACRWEGRWQAAEAEVEAADARHEKIWQRAKAAEAERNEAERLRKPLIVALAQAEAEVARLREYADRMVVQVDELTEGRIERNAENKRLREALTEAKAQIGHGAFCNCVVCSPLIAALAETT